LGNLLADHGNFDEAKQQFAVCIQLDSGNYQAHLVLGLILMREGNTAEARWECQKAAESPDPGVHDAALHALEQLRR
jgi:Flp pilus assembly protein TadD